jgi:hypothetical protein
VALQDLLAGGFGLLARARDDRALHPNGQTFAAVVTFPRPVPGVPALSRPRQVDGILRLSRAIGLRRELPDILGFALRLHDLHGAGRPQDLLLASSPPPPLHTVLLPRWSFAGAWFTGLLPYRVGATRSLLVAHTTGPGRFALGAADRFHSTIEPLATVEAIARLDPAPAEASSFDPILHADPTFRQDAGPLDDFRKRAYRASRRER